MVNPIDRGKNLVGSVQENVGLPQGALDKLSQASSIIGSGKSLISKAKKFGQGSSVTGRRNGQHILDIASKNWGSQYTYMVKIDRVQSPFEDNVVPCYQVQERTPLVKTENIKLPIYGVLKIPVGRELPSIQVSMYDTEDCIVEKSIRDWAEDIVYLGTSVKTLDECVSKLTIFKLSYLRKTVMITSYDVYPEGDLNITMSSNNSLKELVVDFTVTNIYPREDYTV